MKGKLVIISAPSGAGKTTIVNYLLEQRLNLEFSISATTRKPRGKEVDGTDYYFITSTDFRAKIENGSFAEWEEVYGNHLYGTLKSEIERIWLKKKHVLFDVDVEGGISLKNIYGNRAISIFIMPPSVTELENRLFTRGTDDVSKIRIRISKALQEMKLADQFDNIVINDDLNKAKEEVRAIVHSFLEQ